MLPINLLPNYIFDKNKKRNAFIAYAVAIAAVAFVFIAWSTSVQAKLTAEKDRLAVATDKQNTYNGVDKQIKDVQAKIALTQTKQTFIANAQTWNDSWAFEYDRLRNLTSPYVLLKSMFIPDRQTVKMTGFAANELLIAKWWIALKNRKEIFDNVTIQLPTHPYIPQGAANNANGGFGGAGFGAPGGMPGSGGKPMIGAMGSAGAAGGMPGSGGMGMMGMGGGGGAGGANSAEVGPALIEDRPGINFVVTAKLKTPLAGAVVGVPAWPIGAGATGGGAGGPMGGPPGGFPGMPSSGGMGGSAGMGGGKMGGAGRD